MNGLFQGVTSIGINYATQELGLNPLLANMGFSVIASAINAGIQAVIGGSQNVFKSFFDTYISNALTFLGYGNITDPNYAWMKASYMAQIQDFTDIVRKDGLVVALNTYGASFFNSTTVGAITQSGMTIGKYFDDKLSKGQSTDRTLPNGKVVKQVAVGTVANVFFEQKQNGTSFYWDLVGTEYFNPDGTSIVYGEPGVDSYAKLGYTDAEIYSMFGSDTQFQRIENGEQAYAEIKDSQGNTLLVIEPTTDGSYNVYDSLGDYVNAKIDDYVTNKKYLFDESKLNGYSEFDPLTLEELVGLDLNDPDVINLILGSNITPEQFNSLNLTATDKLNILNFYVCTNGINNKNPLGPPAYMAGLLRQLALADPTAIDSIVVPLYNGNGGWLQVPQNIADWIYNTYLYSDDIAYQIVNSIYDHFNNILPADMVGFAYSGGGDQLLKALNLRHEIDMKSVVLLGAPLKEGRIITNPNVENVIMIQGDKDAIGDIYHYFGGSPNPINEFHIVLEGYEHTDYLYDPLDPNASSKNVEASSVQLQPGVDTIGSF